MAYSMDLREKVLAACDRGESTASVAARFEIGERTIRAYKRRRRETGDVRPGKPGPTGPIKLTEADHQKLRELLAERPDMTLLELNDHMSASVAESTISRTLKKLGLSRKKRR